MSKNVAIGGNRLGSGNDMNVSLRNYERSTHDLGYLWKSTMAAGTLVPFMSEVGLPGDSFKIKLNTHLMTIPTNGPLFGSFKVQLDVFQVPIRLYVNQLHNNAINVGRNMGNIHLPQMELTSVNPPATEEDIDNFQINPSNIFSYFNIRGLGRDPVNSKLLKREFNAIPVLAYYDIYKNYYANLQEEQGVIINKTIFDYTTAIISSSYFTSNGTPSPVSLNNDTTNDIWEASGGSPGFVDEIQINFDKNINLIPRNRFSIRYVDEYGLIRNSTLENPPSNWNIVIGGTSIVIGFNSEQGKEIVEFKFYFDYSESDDLELLRFDLNDIDEVRNLLVGYGDITFTSGYSKQPWNTILQHNANAIEDEFRGVMQYGQTGLAVKTYQSDLFNNWLATEWLDGENGVNELTKVKVDEDGFLLDDFNIMSKLYLLLNRVAVSGGTYKSWLETVYSHDIKMWNVESPVYLGGLIRELTFDEVISSVADANDNPLGTLGGRGVMTNKKKGGYIDVKIDEPSYLIGIISLTPRIDYSQGNKWDMNLKTMDDFHKPQLDGIGFQDLITDQMAWFDTQIDSDNGQEVQFNSAGKQPAWINYMTNVNQTRGNFAINGQEMFMTLNRKYDFNEIGIKDLTTYIDPSKFNDVFAEGELDAQNFWAQVKVDITARRKMSAKIIPNL